MELLRPRHLNCTYSGENEVLWGADDGVGHLRRVKYVQGIWTCESSGHGVTFFSLGLLLCVR